MLGPVPPLPTAHFWLLQGRGPSGPCQISCSQHGSLALAALSFPGREAGAGGREGEAAMSPFCHHRPSQGDVQQNWLLTRKLLFSDPWKEEGGRSSQGASTWGSLCLWGPGSGLPGRAGGSQPRGSSRRRRRKRREAPRAVLRAPEGGGGPASCVPDSALPRLA